MRASIHRFRDVATVVVALELVVIAALGIWAAQNEYVQYGDEMIHLSYTKFIAEHGRLPQLGKAVVPSDVLDLNRSEHGGQIDCHPQDPTTGMTLCGIYEAFQPPLYYLATVPVYALGRAGSLGGSEHRAFELMRLFGVVMLLVGTGLAMLLVREVVGADDAMPVSAVVVVVFMLPGTIIRFVTVANAVLELPLALALTILLWRAWTRDSERALVGASVIFGLCMLTKLTMAPLAVPLILTAAVLLWRRRTSWRRVAGVAALVLLLPLALLAPWLLSNRDRYGAWTADALAKKIQAPAINPTNRAIPYDEIVDDARDELQRVAVPQEWSPDLDPGIARQLRWALELALFTVPFVLAVFRACGWRRSIPERVGDPRSWVLLVVPFAVALLFLGYTSHAERWNVMLGRYLLFTLPPLAVFGALQWRAALRSRASTTTLGVALAVLTFVLWVQLAPHRPVNVDLRNAPSGAAAIGRMDA